MTIPFETLKARLLANPKVKAEYRAGPGVRDFREARRALRQPAAAKEVAVGRIS